MAVQRRDVVLCAVLGIVLLLCELAVVRHWANKGRLVPGRIERLDPRHEHGWNPREKKVVSYLTRYLDPRGDAGNPHPSGPVVLRNPRTGEAVTVVSAEEVDLSNNLEVRDRYIRPIPRKSRQSREAQERFAMAERNSQIVLVDKLTNQTIATVCSGELPPHSVFAEGGIVLVYSDRLEWFALPPQVVRPRLWPRLLFPAVVLLGIALLVRWLWKRSSEQKTAGTLDTNGAA